MPNRGTVLALVPTGTFTSDQIDTLAALLGTVAKAPVAKSASFTADDLPETVYLCDSTSAVITVTLLSAVGRAGYKVHCINPLATGNGITFTPAGSEKINGASSLTMGNQHESTILISDGVGWYIVSDYGGSVLP